MQTELYLQLLPHPGNRTQNFRVKQQVILVSIASYQCGNQLRKLAQRAQRLRAVRVFIDAIDGQDGYGFMRDRRRFGVKYRRSHESLDRLDSFIVAQHFKLSCGIHLIQNPGLPRDGNLADDIGAKLPAPMSHKLVAIRNEAFQNDLVLVLIDPEERYCVSEVHFLHNSEHLLHEESEFRFRTPFPHKDIFVYIEEVGRLELIICNGCDLAPFRCRGSSRLIR